MVVEMLQFRRFFSKLHIFVFLLPCNDQDEWRNGSALVFGAKGCRFESGLVRPSCLIARSRNYLFVEPRHIRVNF